MNIVRDDGADRCDFEELSERLFRFNQARSGSPQFDAFGVWVRGGKGELQGGATGWSRWGWLHVDVVWLDESCRGEGIGTRLMEEVEAVARSRGCTLIDLDTFSFQAPEFYRKRGYEEFAALEIGEGAMRRQYFRKRL